MSQGNEQIANTRPVWLQYCIDYCTTGNIFAKLGVVFLFMGFIFLLSYAAESGYFPVKWRLISTGGLAAVLLMLGWLLRTRKRSYSLALDGAGFGLAYIILFMCSPHVYHYLSADWVLSLMAGLSIVVAVIAYSQNAPSLITLAQLAGFLAPILSGYMVGNAEFLFTYYFILNLSIAWIAWHKSWGALNFIGFVFTFILATVWIQCDYQSGHAYMIAQVYLMLFTVLYTLISVMGAFRSKGISSKYFLDSIVLWGMPLVAFCLEYQLLSQQDPWSRHFFGYMGLATYVLYGLVAVLFALYYAVVSITLFAIKSAALQSIRRVYASVSLLFVGLACLYFAIHFGLRVDWPLLIVAILGFISLLAAEKCHEKPIYILSLILSLLAVVVIVLFGSMLPFYMIFSMINSSSTHIQHFFVSGALTSAILLLTNIWVKDPDSNPMLYQSTRHVLAVISYIALLYYGFLYVCYMGFYNWSALYIGASILVLMLVNRRQKKSYVDYLGFVYLACAALKMGSLFMRMNDEGYHWFMQNHHFWALKTTGFWIAMTLMLSFMFREINQRHYFKKYFPNLYLLLFGYYLLSFSVIFNIALNAFGLFGVAYYSLYATLLVSLVVCFIGAKVWLDDKSSLFELFERKASGFLCIAVVVFTLITQFKSSHAVTSFYLPILNSTDLLSLLSLGLVYAWFQYNRPWLQNFDADTSLMFFLFSIVCIVCLSGAAINAIVHWFPAGNDNSLDSLFHLRDMAIQATLTILWGLIAFFTIIVSNIKQNKKMWWSGMALLGVVILKLLIIDMYNSNTLERIISFLGVAVLLLVLGYFSPAMPKQSKQKGE
jgi:uncharacterized membrane protein